MSLRKLLEWNWMMVRKQPVLMLSCALGFSSPVMVYFAHSKDGLINENDDGLNKHVVPRHMPRV
eukprot:m.8007 g.8007  ORF g.8007 m.8007 type:complete len:64 (+) comp4980_c0_seq2:86-277(+)